MFNDKVQQAYNTRWVVYCEPALAGVQDRTNGGSKGAAKDPFTGWFSSESTKDTCLRTNQHCDCPATGKGMSGNQQKEIKTARLMVKISS